MTNSEFVVTEHQAKRAGLHWDLRFEIPKSKMWASFAVRKGVPLNPGTKVLAVRTHDHKRDEALLTGKIESGYGAGTFKEWDRGKCIIHKYSTAHMAIEFKGKKVKGIYHLVNIGVADKNFKGEQYFLFKGKVVSEIMGMASRIPSRGVATDTEIGSSYDTSDPLPWSLAENYPDMSGGGGMQTRLPPADTSEVESSDEEEDKATHKKLPWSISEGEKIMNDYALIATFTAMKGFFTQKAVGEYLLVALKDTKNNSFVLLQFYGRLKDDMYIVGIIASESPDDDVLEQELDQLRYHSQVKILEDKLPISVNFGNKITVKFKKSSKYVGNQIELFDDSRLDRGYMIAKTKMKKGFEPAQQFKIGADAGEMNQFKKMRAFAVSRLKTIMKQKN